MTEIPHEKHRNTENPNVSLNMYVARTISVAFA